VITVLGSINLDIVVPVERCPRPGETVKGGDVRYLPGGKGANQALAARKLGAAVRMVGAVGRDAAAGIALSGLRLSGVDCSSVVESDRPTGVATIAVGADGENLIVVAPGANGDVSVAQAEALDLSAQDLLVLQMEIPAESVVAALMHARARSARTILNLAPAVPLADEVLRLAHVLVVNESEAATLANGVMPEGLANTLSRRLGITVIVTAGAEGAVCARDGQTLFVPAAKVAVVDTTGAGDAFVGALAEALDADHDLPAALARAVAAASLACTGFGAQSALPDQNTLSHLLGETL
jgi:ribokinase